MAGIPASIIIRRNRFDKINEAISHIDSGEWKAVEKAYEDYLSMGTTFYLDQLCKKYELKTEDVIFWFNY